MSDKAANLLFCISELRVSNLGRITTINTEMSRNFSVTPRRYLKLGHDTLILEHLPVVLSLRAAQFDTNSALK
jgi:hypothetical protein